MHKFLRAVGFSSCTRRRDVEEILDRIENEAKLIRVVHDENGDVRAQKLMFMGKRIGVCVCGTMNDDDEFDREFYFPWHEGNCITTQAPCQIQKQAEKDAFSGICDERGLGVSLIYYLQNQLEYMENDLNHQRFCYISSVLMSGLSVEGKVLLPVHKNSENKISLLQCQDIYSVVETCFMPFGVESDQYAIVGEITEVVECRNEWTGELVYSLTVSCNGLNFHVCINEADLMGIPAPGRRFKGTIWMQGIATISEAR